MHYKDKKNKWICIILIIYGHYSYTDNAVNHLLCHFKLGKVMLLFFLCLILIFYHTKQCYCYSSKVIFSWLFLKNILFEN